MVTIKDVHQAIWEHIADEYRAGASITALAKRHKSSKYIIGTGLRAVGVDTSLRMGRPPSEFCQRGHSMAIHGKRLVTKGKDIGRFCSECKRERQRVKR